MGQEISKITDRDEALAEVSNNGYSYYYLNDTFKNDREIAMTAVMHELEAMASCPMKFREDKSFVMDVLSCQPMVVEYISSKLQDNMEIMSIAVYENAYALQYASNRLKNSAKLVLIAIENDPGVIEFASEGLQKIAGDNPEGNLTQFLKTGKIFKELNKNLKHNDDSDDIKKLKI